MLQNLERISPLSIEVLNFLNNLSLNEKVNRIIVFGSRAIGDYEKYSDLDVAIDATNLSKSEWLKMKEFAIYDLKTVLRISLVDYSTNPPKLKERITQTGIIIYEKRSKT